MIGFGGILVMDETAAEADRIVGQAIDLGVNYFDVAPSYGNAEAMLGPALERYRKQVFLACKTGERSKDKAAAELRASLGRLRTDHVDLYQMHCLEKPADIEQAFGPGGAIEAFVEARAQGLTRYLGFSAHTEEAALAALDRFSFDTILFPLNIYTWHLGHFGPRVLEKAAAKKMGILALKCAAKRSWHDGEEKKWKKTWYSPVDTYEETLTGVRFTLSLPVAAAVSPGHEQFFLWMVRAANEFSPLPEKEAETLARATPESSPIFISQTS